MTFDFRKTGQRLSDFLADKWIIVVEPSQNYRTSLKQFLANLKCEQLKAVPSVKDAQREMLTKKVGLFIVEWNLKDTNGLQFCRDLRQQEVFAEAPFLLLSAEGLRQDIVLAAEVEVDGYLLKPFSFEQFCSQLDQLIKKFSEPQRIENLVLLAIERRERGDLSGADENLRLALEIRPDSAKVVAEIGKLAFARGDKDEAIRCLTRATAINAEYIDAFRTLLEIAQQTDDITLTMKMAERLHDLSPENPRYTLLLAKCYLESKALHSSEIYYRKTVGLSPTLAEAYKGLGQVYMLQKEYQKAMKNFNKALDLDKNDVSIVNSLGLALVRLGKIREGIERYLMALKLDPCNHRVLFNIGNAYEKTDDFDKAKWYYSQALTHKPDFSKARRGIERLTKEAS